MKSRLLAILLALVMVLSAVPQAAFAAAGGADDPDGAPAPQKESEHALKLSGRNTAKRTIMMYLCGSDLESRAAMATFNLKQILKSNFSSDDDINFIIMTGGSARWHLDDDEDPNNENKYLVFPDGVNVPEDAVVAPDPQNPSDYKRAYPKGRISGAYNQLWEARGADSPENAGKLVLLDGDGITGAEGQAVDNYSEVMSDPAVLKTFINYAAANYPAEKYDLILWDHGGGPQGGFGYDEHYYRSREMVEAGILSHLTIGGLVDAISDNLVVDSNKDGTQDSRFDFINFDACLMGNVELAFTLADYMKYYIASADTLPGYGEYYGPADGTTYKGWLDELGKSDMDAVYNAEDGSYALGKIMADDLYEFYSKEEGEGSNGKATLAVYDIDKMLASDDLMSALKELSGKLKGEADGTEGKPIMFYDEIRSYGKSINYADSMLFDLGDMAAFLGTADVEQDEEAKARGDYSNIYSDLAKRFRALFPISAYGLVMENDFMYARYTMNQKTEPAYYYDEEAEGQREYGQLFSTGLTVFFPDPFEQSEASNYLEAMDPVLKSMPVKDDGRYSFLKEYMEVVADYNLLMLTGSSISDVLNDERAFYPHENPVIGDKSKVDYDLMMNYWSDDNAEIWDPMMTGLLQYREAGVEGSVPWLKKVIAQMTDDAIIASGVDVTEIQHKGNTGYSVELKEGSPRVFMTVEQNVIAELPALVDYIDTLDEWDKMSVKKNGILSIGTIKGYNDEGNIWMIPPLEQKWFAVNDASGQNHVATLYSKTADLIIVPAIYGTSDDGPVRDRVVFMYFETGDAETVSHTLKSLYFSKSGGGSMMVDPASLTSDLTLMPVMFISNSFGMVTDFAPVSLTSFVINGSNASSVTLDFTDISNIPDIADAPEGGKKLSRTFSVSDLYGCQIDITNRVNKTLMHISLAEIKPAVYNGKEQTPVVTYDGKTLREGVDYLWDKVADVTGEGEEEEYITPKYKDVRDYEVLLTGLGEFAGFANTIFSIKKAANTLSASGKTAKVSYRKLRKKNQKLALSKVVKFKKPGQGKMSYAKTSGSKKILVNKKNGQVTVKKGLKKGTYKVKMTIKAAGTKNYKPATKKVTFKILVR